MNALGASRTRSEILRASDSLGLAREDGWHPGEASVVPFVVARDVLPVETSTEGEHP